MGNRITDWMLKHGIAEWDPNDPPREQEQSSDDQPKGGKR